MTAIRGYVGPTAEDGALGIHSLDQFVLSGARPGGRAKNSTATSGSTSDDPAMRCRCKTFGHEHRWGSVVEGRQQALHHLSFGCYADDLPRLKARIEKNGIKLVDPPPGFESNGFWFRDHDGVLIEMKVAPKVSPDHKSAVRWINPAAGVAARAAAHRIRPGAAAPAVARADLHDRYRRGDRVLQRAISGCDCPTGPPTSSPSCTASTAATITCWPGEVRRAGHPSLQLGRVSGRRHRPRRHAHGRQGLQQGLGPRPPRARLELLPLRAGPVGQLLRIFLRHRLHPVGQGPGKPARTIRKIRSICGVPIRRRISPIITSSPAANSAA